MKNVIFIFWLSTCLSSFPQKRSVYGTIKDAETKQTLPFCMVALSKTTISVVANVDGKFKIEIPDEIKNPKLIISYFGYKTDTIEITDQKNEYLILLDPILANLNEVIITGVSKATLIRENPIAIINISLKAIDRAAESNIIDALVKNAPGLNAVKTGPNISKPFIRGLGYNRVLTLYDGIRQEGQQWGDEHGIEVDAYNMQKAEVIKGPASLMYGSDALAGVVSFMPYIPYEKDGVIKGRLLSEYQSNNGLIGNGLRLGYCNNHWLWAVRGNYRIAKNYTNNVDGSVYNTGFQEKNASFIIGHISKKGYTHLNFTMYDNLQGIPDGSRDSLSRKFTKQIYEGNFDNIKSRPLVSDAELNSYKLSALYQHIQHYRIYTINHYQVAQGDIDIMAGFQQNVRREYDHPTYPNQAGMFVCLNTINYSVRYNVPKFLNIETTIGLNGMYQNNENKNATDFPIPNYNLFDLGSYIHAKWKYYRWTISGGLRYDNRSLKSDNFYIGLNPENSFIQQTKADAIGANLQFASLNKIFNGISSSIGTTYQLSNKMSLKFNIARGYRAPSITELASNGLDPGAHIVYLGNRNFSPEFSLQEDIGISGNFKNVAINFSIFNNNIQNYIYLSQLIDDNGTPVIISQGNKTFQYQQASAQLYGAEFSLDFNPAFIKGFSFNNNFSWVYGFNTKNEYKGKGINGEYLPFIPPLKLLSDICQEIKTNNKIIPEFNMKVELDYNAKQNRYMALYNTETLTAGYTLFNVAAGVHVRYAKSQIMQFQIQINNLFDVAYQSNLSRLKYFEYYLQSPNNKYGMYGMGRNICFKLIFPF